MIVLSGLTPSPVYLADQKKRTLHPAIVAALREQKRDKSIPLFKENSCIIRSYALQVAPDSTIPSGLSFSVIKCADHGRRGYLWESTKHFDLTPGGVIQDAQETIEEPPRGSLPRQNMTVGIDLERAKSHLKKALFPQDYHFANPFRQAVAQKCREGKKKQPVPPTHAFPISTKELRALKKTAPTRINDGMTVREAKLIKAAQRKLKELAEPLTKLDQAIRDQREQLAVATPKVSGGSGVPRKGFPTNPHDILTNPKLITVNGTPVKRSKPKG